MSKIVLDASALLAMLNGERGATQVASAIADAQISAVSYAEVISHFVYAGMPERDVNDMLDPLPITIVAADQGLAQMAGKIHNLTASAGLSLSDRFCLALALRDSLPVWTSDTQWKGIADAVEVKVILIR